MCKQVCAACDTCAAGGCRNKPPWRRLRADEIRRRCSRKPGRGSVNITLIGASSTRRSCVSASDPVPRLAVLTKRSTSWRGRLSRRSLTDAVKHFDELVVLADKKQLWRTGQKRLRCAANRCSTWRFRSLSETGMVTARTIRSPDFRAGFYRRVASANPRPRSLPADGRRAV